MVVVPFDDLQRSGHVQEIGPDPCYAPTSHNSAAYPRRSDTEARWQPQTLCFKAATGKAFTMVRAGLAFTKRISPKISFLQALVAGLTRVLIRQSPGKVKMPFFLTSCAPISARLAMILPATFCLISNSAARLAAMAPFVMAFPALAFMAFM